MKKTNDIDLRLISAYWCNHVAADYEDRFVWSWDKVEFEEIEHVGERARSILVALAKSAPNERGDAYFAAGPLENYINLIVQEKDANEAAFIIGNIHLKKLLPLAWGDIQELEPLARHKDSTVHFQEPYPEKGLKALELKEVMGFWCQTCVSSIVTDYEGYYQQVLKKLFNKGKREDAIHDLLASAPDDRAVTYLNENIFVLQK